MSGESEKPIMHDADVVVIGAGPAGLMAAISAARAGADVVVLEQMPKPGLKLLTTGGGRCNVTNALGQEEFMARFGRGGRFMLPALEAMDSAKLREFLTKRGVLTHCQDGFHYFPVSESARDVLECLLNEARAAGVRLKLGEKAERLVFNKENRTDEEEPSGIIQIDVHWGKVRTRCVVLATGGKSYAALGSTGRGYILAHAAGHTIAEPLPALVPLVTAEKWPGRCAGIVISGARVRIDLPRQPKAGWVGELLFTHRGISGPVVLDLSREVSLLLQSCESVPLRLTVTGEELNEAQWGDRIEAWVRDAPRKHVANLTAQLMAHGLAKELCALAGVGDEVTPAHLSRRQHHALAALLCNVPLTITATEGFDKAMVTRGGVSLKEVHPESLESRKQEGLFFAGEALNLDGPCGGYNLQWAFSSGWLAGLCAAEKAREIKAAQTA